MIEEDIKMYQEQLEEAEVEKEQIEEKIRTLTKLIQKLEERKEMEELWKTL